MTLVSTQIIDIIQIVGFPIAAFLIMVWLCVRILDFSKISVDTNTQAINDLTVAIKAMKR